MNKMKTTEYSPVQNGSGGRWVFLLTPRVTHGFRSQGSQHGSMFSTQTLKAGDWSLTSDDQGWPGMTMDVDVLKPFGFLFEWWNLMKCVWNLGLDHVETISINFQERQDEQLTYIHQRCGWIVNNSAHLNGNSMSKIGRCNKTFKKKPTFGATKTKQEQKMMMVNSKLWFVSPVCPKSTLAKRLRGVSSYCRMTAKPMLKEDLSQAFLAVRESSKLIMWRVAFSIW